MAKAEEVVEAPDPDAEADKIVADAEAAAMEAESLLAELEHRVEGGDESVTREAVEKAEKDRNWLRKLIAGAKVRADALKEENRQSKLATLSGELAAFDLGDTYEQLGRELAAKVEEFVQAFVDRNEAIAAFRRRAEQLGVPAHTGGKFASARDAYLELGGNGALVSADRVFEPKHSGVYVHEIIEGVRAKMYEASRADVAYFRVPFDVSSLELDDVYSQLKSIDAEQSESTAGHFYYRAAEWRTANPNATPVTYQPVQIQGGGVFRWADDLTEEEQRRRNVVKITEEDARGDY